MLLISNTFALFASFAPLRVNPLRLCSLGGLALTALIPRPFSHRTVGEGAPLDVRDRHCANGMGWFDALSDRISASREIASPRRARLAMTDGEAAATARLLAIH